MSASTESVATGSAVPSTAPATSRLVNDRAASIVARQATESLPARDSQPIESSATAMTFDGLPGRDLDQDELLELAASIAATPDLWREHVAFDDDQRHYVCLYRDTHVDVWVLCWTPQNDTGWHDHDISSGAVAVTEGCLIERNLAVDRPSLATEIPTGRVFSFGPDHIHRLTGRDAGSVSIHTYSPPLWRMGQYVVGRGGVLRRTSVSYADELRPLDAMI